MHKYSTLTLTLLILIGAVAPVAGNAAKADIEERISRLPSASSQISASPAFKTPKLLGVFSVKTRKAWITAYSSTPDQTDDTPFTTASGSHVRDGIVATNFLPFGTRVRIPGLFGEKVFVVEDRMHARMKNGMDVWMPTREQAITFGSAYADIEIVDEQVAVAK